MKLMKDVNQSTKDFVPVEPHIEDPFQMTKEIMNAAADTPEQPDESSEKTHILDYMSSLQSEK